MSAFGKGRRPVSHGHAGAFSEFHQPAFVHALGSGRRRGRDCERRGSRCIFCAPSAGLLSQVLMFVAVKRMPLVNAVLLSNSAPLFIPLVTWVWLRNGSAEWFG